ncbi:MAG TPA: S1C family serine protease [Candidatus Polarisedimenticolia bacterium]|jgi:S1-C subfamily serine protease
MKIILDKGEAALVGDPVRPEVEYQISLRGESPATTCQRAERVRAGIIGAYPGGLGTEAYERSIERVAQRSLPAVVIITAGSTGNERLGAGFVIDPAGLILTSVHLLEGASWVRIGLYNGRTFNQATVRAYDPERDLVLLDVAAWDLPCLPVRFDPDPTTGGRVVAIGHPHRLCFRVSEGIVSCVRLDPNGTKLVQTTALIGAGSSGGPLLDETGAAVGVMTFQVGRERLDRFSFAIRTCHVGELLEAMERLTLEEFGKRRHLDRVAGRTTISERPAERWRPVHAACPGRERT